MGGRKLGIRHYFQGSSFPASYAASAWSGEAGVRKMLVDIEPNPDGSQASQVSRLLASCNAAGLNMAITIAHGAPKKLPNPDAYWKMLRAYGPLVLTNGYELILDYTAWQIVKNQAFTRGWDPPADILAMITALAPEFYEIDYRDGVNLDLAAEWADAHGKPLGLSEYGANAGPPGLGGADPQATDVQAQAYFSYVITFLSARITAGKPPWGVLAWNDPHSASGPTPGFTLDRQPASWVKAQQAVCDLVTAS